MVLWQVVEVQDGMLACWRSDFLCIISDIYTLHTSRSNTRGTYAVEAGTFLLQCWRNWPEFLGGSLDLKSKPARRVAHHMIPEASYTIQDWDLWWSRHVLRDDFVSWRSVHWTEGQQNWAAWGSFVWWNIDWERWVSVGPLDAIAPDRLTPARRKAPLIDLCIFFWKN